MFDRIVLTCEHATNRIPAQYRHLFRSAGSVLDGHRAYDVGAIDVARIMARMLHAPLHPGGVCRLLVDLNRSLGHPRLFSEYVRPLSPRQKSEILGQYYAPHRERIRRAIAGEVRAGRRVLHLGVHSFVPVLDGRVRSADVGLLYDPGRQLERTAAGRLRDQLAAASDFTIRRNYPYRGISDGLTTHLRRLFGSRLYAGIEIELNQACLTTPGEIRTMARLLAGAARELVRQPTRLRSGS